MERKAAHAATDEAQVSARSRRGAWALALAGTSGVSFFLAWAIDASSDDLLPTGGLLFAGLWFLAGIGALIAGLVALAGSGPRDRSLGLVALGYVAMAVLGLVLLSELG